MNAPVSETTPGDDDSDLNAWLQSLSTGSANRKAGTAPTEEDAMHRAILKYHQRQDDQALDSAELLSEEHAWQRMRFRLKQEGLLSRQRPAWQLWAPAAAVAMVLVAVLGPNLWQSQSPDASTILVSYNKPPTLRSLATGNQQAVRDPLKTARHIATRLHALDPSVKLYWYEGVATLDFEAQPEQIDAMTALLQPTHPKAILRPGWNRILLTRQTQSQ